MVTVTGGLTDAVGFYDPDIDLRLIFRLSNLSVSGSGRMIHTKPIIVDEFTGSSGSWSVDLDVTEGLRGLNGRGVWYDISVERQVTSGDWMPWDHESIRLQVPVDGGHIGNLIDLVVGNDMVYTGPDAMRPELRTGFQFNTVTNDLYERVVTVT